MGTSWSSQRREAKLIEEAARDRSFDERLRQVIEQSVAGGLHGVAVTGGDGGVGGAGAAMRPRDARDAHCVDGGDDGDGDEEEHRRRIARQHERHMESVRWLYASRRGGSGSSSGKTGSRRSGGRHASPTAFPPAGREVPPRTGQPRLRRRETRITNADCERATGRRKPPPDLWKPLPSLPTATTPLSDPSTDGERQTSSQGSAVTAMEPGVCGYAAAAAAAPGLAQPEEAQSSSGDETAAAPVSFSGSSAVTTPGCTDTDAGWWHAAASIKAAERPFTYAAPSSGESESPPGVVPVICIQPPTPTPSNRGFDFGSGPVPSATDMPTAAEEEGGPAQPLLHRRRRASSAARPVSPPLPSESTGDPVPMRPTFPELDPRLLYPGRPRCEGWRECQEIMKALIETIPLEPPVDEPPVDEPPVDEPPVDEPPVDEQSVDEQPADEQPADEQPAAQHPQRRDSSPAGGTESRYDGSGWGCDDECNWQGHFDDWIAEEPRDSRSRASPRRSTTCSTISSSSSNTSRRLSIFSRRSSSSSSNSSSSSDSNSSDSSINSSRGSGSGRTSRASLRRFEEERRHSSRRILRRRRSSVKKIINHPQALESFYY